MLKDKPNAQCYFIIIQRDMSFWAKREELPATLACYTFSERSWYADPFSPWENRGPHLWWSCEFEGPVPELKPGILVPISENFNSKFSEPGFPWRN